MASLKEIRTRIKSVNSTQQITSAMKMVSAAKLQKAQTAILQIRPYADKLHEILKHLSKAADSDDNIYALQRPIKKALIVILTSNKGLCGAFNSSILKKAFNIAESKYSDLLKNDTLHFITIGKKATDAIKAKGYTIYRSYDYIWDELNFTAVAPMAQSVMDCFTTKLYDKVDIIYNQFRNAAVQDLMFEQFLPIIPDVEDGQTQSHEYIYEPSKEYIVTELIPKSLRIEFYKALLDSQAGEHGARMTAMHKATENATELLKDLKITYNKARQASITNEILEIVGGAEALKK